MARLVDPELAKPGDDEAREHAPAAVITGVLPVDAGREHAARRRRAPAAARTLGRMRIIAGERRGMRLKAPRGRATRPTADRTREALFAMLGDVSDLSVLDAFAGTGALGLEALSRGAREATFWETDVLALRALRENVERLGYGDRASVERADARRRLASLAREGRAFDLLLLDPPYTMLPALQDVFCLHLPRLLVPGGLAVLESPAASTPPELPLGRELSRVYGEARITLLRRA